MSFGVLLMDLEAASTLLIVMFSVAAAPLRPYVLLQSLKTRRLLSENHLFVGFICVETKYS